MSRIRQGDHQGAVHTPPKTARSLRLVAQAGDNYTPTQDDLDLERELWRLLNAIQTASCKDRKRVLWAEYREVHSRRSDGFVAFLERQKGLR